MISIKVNGSEYALASTLRVAYKIQGCNNHEAYSKVFSKIGDAPLEKQIEMLYCAFQVANPEVKMSSAEFLNYYLDNYNLSDLLSHIQAVIEGITGPMDDLNNKAESTQGN